MNGKVMSGDCGVDGCVGEVQDLLSPDVYHEFDQSATLSDHLSDHMRDGLSDESVRRYIPSCWGRAARRRTRECMHQEA